MNSVTAAYMGVLAAYTGTPLPRSRESRKSPQLDAQSLLPYQTAEGIRQVNQADGSLDMLL